METLVGNCDTQSFVAQKDCLATRIIIQARRSCIRVLLIVSSFGIFIPSCGSNLLNVFVSMKYFAIKNEPQDKPTKIARLVVVIDCLCRSNPGILTENEEKSLVTEFECEKKS